jgi:hypothetical protein
MVRHAVQVARRVRLAVVDRRRHHAGLDALDAADQRQRPGGAGGVADHRLDGAHRDPRSVGAEGALDGKGLRRVVEPRAGAVGADVVHRLGGDAGVLDGPADREGRVLPAGLRRRQVEGVLGGPEADHLGVDPRPAPQGVLQLLEQHDPAAFPAGRAQAPGVEGAHRPGRVVPRRGHGPDRPEGHREEGRHAGVGAAADGRHRIVALHHPGSLADGVGAGGARESRRGGRAVQAVGERDLARRHVGDEGRHVEGGDPGAPARRERQRLLLDGGRAADRRADLDGNP